MLNSWLNSFEFNEMSDTLEFGAVLACWCGVGDCDKKLLQHFFHPHSLGALLHIPIVFPFVLSMVRTEIGTDRFSFNFSRVSIYGPIKINTTLLARKERDALILNCAVCSPFFSPSIAGM